MEIKKYDIASNAQSTILVSKERFIKDTKEGNYSVNLTIKVFQRQVYHYFLQHIL